MDISYTSYINIRSSQPGCLAFGICRTHLIIRLHVFHRVARTAKEQHRKLRRHLHRRHRSYVYDRKLGGAHASTLLYCSTCRDHSATRKDLKDSFQRARSNNWVEAASHERVGVACYNVTGAEYAQRWPLLMIGKPARSPSGGGQIGMLQPILCSTGLRVSGLLSGPYH